MKRAAGIKSGRGIGRSGLKGEGTLEGDLVLLDRLQDQVTAVGPDDFPGETQAQADAVDLPIMGGIPAVEPLEESLRIES